MELKETLIPGCYKIALDSFEDNRGSFFKTFHSDVFEEKGLCCNWKEEYFSVSNKNVIRGMHFQTPPMDHDKIVTCLTGSVLDVVIDLRKNSPQFKKYATFKLDSNTLDKMLYIPKGCAHGFMSLEDNTLMYYKVSSVYSPENDKGIHWNSIGFEWNVIKPIVSERDKNHPSLKDFQSPF
ncbi:dTDP-4-dehydrorhamnose 3,5-epimerase [Aquimarina sp. U1-2]|uniref:dTDP-4-dehydrorhamnose 3,5-epimerase n=1 Tax=Aquimarina sp. U1-2 TaxID=2823141 RepID=UPI001AECACE8|nr:dTDP-4-dehydrorhamnose 3,5-epimerase [Aquimarina sp. U1-2]MBP2833877.1 dTDP-4-dehydrorhamnose 3,5-epimerase [Aquimarina sp. U1-2]